jgi:hypothetical protein
MNAVSRKEFCFSVCSRGLFKAQDLCPVLPCNVRSLYSFYVANSTLWKQFIGLIDEVKKYEVCDVL